MRTASKAGRQRLGQAMIETVVVLLAICFLFLALVQLVQIYNTRLVLQHAASRAARARTVGFHSDYVRRVIDVATIPVAGKRLTPTDTSGGGTGLPLADPIRAWDQALRNPAGSVDTLERELIPEYLGCEWTSQARGMLDYANWRRIGASAGVLNAIAPLKTVVTLHLPLLLSREELEQGEFIQSGPADPEETAPKGTIPVAASVEIEPHAALYLDSNGW